MPISSNDAIAVPEGDIPGGTLTGGHAPGRAIGGGVWAAGTWGAEGRAIAGGVGVAGCGNGGYGWDDVCWSRKTKLVLSPSPTTLLFCSAPCGTRCWLMAIKLFGARFSIVQVLPCRRMHACRRETLGSSTTISFSPSRPIVVTALEIAMTLSVSGPLKNWMLTPLIGISSALKSVLLDLRLPISSQVYISTAQFAREFRAAFFLQHLQMAHVLSILHLGRKRTLSSPVPFSLFLSQSFAVPHHYLLQCPGNNVYF